MMDLFADIPKVRMSKGAVKKGKKCAKCGKYKSLKYFYHSSGTKDGYRSACKECDAKAQHNRRLHIVYRQVDEKQCSDCGVVKPIAEFGIDKTKKDMHRSYCLACLRERSRMYNKYRVRSLMNEKIK